MSHSEFGDISSPLGPLNFYIKPKIDKKRPPHLFSYKLTQIHCYYKDGSGSIKKGVNFAKSKK